MSKSFIDQKCFESFETDFQLTVSFFWEWGGGLSQIMRQCPCFSSIFYLGLPLTTTFKLGQCLRILWRCIVLISKLQTYISMTSKQSSFFCPMVTKGPDPVVSTRKLHCLALNVMLKYCTAGWRIEFESVHCNWPPDPSCNQALIVQSNSWPCIFYSWKPQ